MVSRAALLNRTVKTLLSHTNQLELAFINLAYRHRSSGIAHETFERHAAVNREDVAFLQDVLRRKTVDDLLVDGGTD